MTEGDSRYDEPGWIVYVAIDDGAILISTSEDSPFLSDDRQAAGVHRIPHVIGRGRTEEEAKTDARRELRLRGGPTNPLI